MIKKIILDTLSLVVITVAAGLLLSTVHGLTEDKIELAEKEERLSSYRVVFEQAADFKDVENFEQTASNVSDKFNPGVTVEEAKCALDSNGNIIGAVISATSANGYGGNINLSVGVDLSNTITGMRVTSMSESPGYGAHCQDEDFQEQFKGICGAVSFVKDGSSGPGEIDMISGATMTTSAVTEAVNAALEFADYYLGGVAK